MLTAGVGQALYGLATVGEVRHDGSGIVATHIEEGEVPPPFSDRHADVIVSSSTLVRRCRRSTVNDMTDELPLLAADLTFVRVNGDRACSGLANRDDETPDPQVGDHVMVADGGTGPLEAVIDDVRNDGTIDLKVLAHEGR